MDIKRSTTPEVTAGEELSTLLKYYKDKPTLLLLSGGSALSMLDHVSDDALHPNLTITTLDERFSTDPAINNFAQIKTTAFYKRASDRGVTTIDTSVTETDTLEKSGKRFETALRNWRDENPKGVIIATMGVGVDGHTAGIFPGTQNEYFSDDDWVVAYEVPKSVNPHTKRITVTPRFLLEQVTHAVGFIVGDEKKSVLDNIKKESCSHREVPACVMREINSVTVITDIYTSSLVQ